MQPQVGTGNGNKVVWTESTNTACWGKVSSRGESVMQLLSHRTPEGEFCDFLESSNHASDAIITW
jgi:hypothetical protein